MKYLKFTQYIYLAFAGFFIYDGIMKLNTDESPWLSFIIAIVAVFMFFFRRSFAKKFEDRNQNS
ncbi:uncharacterized membrane protein YobD (UPF0266 family) [Flavobacterium arsenatis]|uniref:Uncharacterized membrane protein YobD (UPF0266 family) n=1 Tax=Flavobacterium arsenatis TaxID=1484332 RepID=A0ABU1TM64_9FLAO|nr:hypothetical protein [Flavobacterium arsenatis]MDR6966912.1 uncharacterized membrane protein YobD (UPF0266 family) [Flavobacterium arsenatis]